MQSFAAINAGESVRFTYWLNMFDTISISASAAAIFSAEVGCGLWPKRKDIVGQCEFDEGDGS